MGLNTVQKQSLQHYNDQILKFQKKSKKRTKSKKKKKEPAAAREQQQQQIVFDHQKKTKENQLLYLKRLKLREKLPAYQIKDQILKLINNQQFTIISGMTGCGKSTQIPQMILEHYLYDKKQYCKIICTQPRRISAIGLAERVSYEQAEAEVGNLIGYRIRLEAKSKGPETQLEYVTVGILLRQIANNIHSLHQITHIIIDEVHERSTDIDFLMLILKYIAKHYTHLKIILMSATLNSELFSQYFDQAEILTIQGRTYPVEINYIEDFYQDLLPPNDQLMIKSSAS